MFIISSNLQESHGHTKTGDNFEVFYVHMELVTLIIAGVGTITSILIFLDRKIGKRKKIKVRVRHGFATSSKKPQKYIIVDLANPRDVAVTITSVNIGSGDDLIYFSPSDVFGYEKFPLKLKPGKSHQLIYDYEIIKKSLEEHGQRKLSALCNDALGRQYKSKQVRFNFNY